MRIRWQAFLMGAGIGLGAAVGWVWWQRRQKQSTPVFVLDQLALSEVQGNWYELAVRDPERGQADWVGTRYQLTSSAEGGQLKCIYQLSQLDAPEQNCEKTVRRQPRQGQGGHLLVGQRSIWILALSPHYLVAASADRQAFWLLARQPELPESEWQQLKAGLSAQGFDPAHWARTPHAPKKPAG